MFDLVPRAPALFEPRPRRGLLGHAIPALPNPVGPPDLGSDAPDSVILGRMYDYRRGIIEGRMRYGGPRHVVIFGPNGTGKGMRLLVPNLLQSEGKSIFVIDPKGELAAITAPYRRQLGRVVILNPFGVLTDIPGYEDLESQGYNPLAALDPDARSFNADASLLADAMIKVEGKDPHWDSSARALLAALIMYAAIEGKRAGRPATVARVRELLCEHVEEPKERNGFRGTGIPARALEMMETPYPGLRNKAAQFADWTNEVRSIASAAKRQTEPFDDTEIADDLAKDGFDFREMKRQPTTVYCILPPEMMERHSKWLRLVLTAAIQGVLRVRKAGEPKTIFMLDEFAALGHLEIIETVWALVRGYGIQIMPVFQDMTQLKGLYGERWETFIGNSGALASFSPNDLTTAEWLSRRAGDTTATVASYHNSTSKSSPEIAFNQSGYQGGSTTRSESVNYTQMKVPLIDPHKLFGMRDGTMIVTMAGLADVVPAFAPGYWEIRQCRERARDNPYYGD
jgi:type IV secretion system protein VirD4